MPLCDKMTTDNARLQKLQRGILKVFTLKK